MAADVVGYSRLMEADEGGTLNRLKALHRDIIDPAIAVDAVTCAIEIQKKIRQFGESGGDSTILFQIGINVGDIIVDGDDIYGDGVNIAARIEALAEPGEVYLSRTSADQVRDKLP
jgi:adenylate cyclase